jgi:hypothetical protein
MKTYYELPTMVKFEDPDNDGWLYGIAYKEEIICACCGGTFDIAELNEDGLEIVEMDWINFVEFIE